MHGLWLVLRRSMRRRPLQLLLSCGAIALGTAALLASQIEINQLVIQAQHAAANRAGESSLDVRVGSGRDMSPGEVSELRLIRGVTTAAPLYTKRVNALSDVNAATGPVVTVVAASGSTVALRAVTMQSGHLPVSTNTKQVALDVGVAQALSTPGHEIHIGSKIALQTATGPDEFDVVGLVSAIGGGPGFVNAPVIVSVRAVDSIFALNLHTPLVALQLKPGTSINDVAGSVRRILGTAALVVNPRDTGSLGFDQVDTLVIFVTALTVMLGAAVVANSVALSASERRSELALLRAAGASSLSVTRMLVTEIALVAVIAVGAGLALGVFLGDLIAQAAAGHAVTVPAIDIKAVALAAGVGFGSAIIGALIPAVAAARANVLDSLRPQPFRRTDRLPRTPLRFAPAATALAVVCFIQGGQFTVAFGSGLLLIAALTALPLVAPLVVRLIALVLRLAVTDTRMSVASISKHPRRTSITQIGLVVSIGLTVATAAIGTSALRSSDQWVSKLFVGNTVVKSPVTEPASIAKAFSSSPDIHDVTTLRIMSLPIAGDTVGLAAIDPDAYRRAGALDVISPSRATAFSKLTEPGGVLVPALLANSNGWSEGTQLAGQVDGQIKTLKVVGIVAHGFPAGEQRETLIIGRVSATAIFGNSAAGFDDLELTSSSPAAVNALAGRYGLSATSVAQIQSSARDAIDNTLGLLQSLTIVAVVIAMLAVINTMFINVRARVRELALLRAVGLSKSRSRSLVLTETGLILGSGIAMGIGVGALVAVPLMSIASTPTFQLVYEFPAAAAFTLIGVLLVLTTTLSLVPAYRASSASIVSALRSE